MANRYATKTGNWSDVTIWDGGTTLPGAGDVVRPNGYTVTIDQDIAVGSLRHNVLSPANAGGYFIVSTIPTTRTITADIFATSERVFVLNAPTGSLRVIGNVMSGSGATAYGIRAISNSPVSLEVVGAVVGGSGSYAYGISIEGTLSVAVTGDVIAGTAGTACALGQNTSAAGVKLIRDGVIKTTSGFSPIFGGAYGGHFITAQNVTFDCRSGGYPSTSNSSDAPIPIYLTAGSETVMTMLNSDVPQTAVHLSVLGSSNPTEDNVRAGTTYGLNNSTGTLAVPPSNSVASGVPVGNTVGTAALNLGAVAAVVGQQIAAALNQ